jgi:hypothetical protein
MFGLKTSVRTVLTKKLGPKLTQKKNFPGVEVVQVLLRLPEGCDDVHASTRTHAGTEGRADRPDEVCTLILRFKSREVPRGDIWPPVVKLAPRGDVYRFPLRTKINP